MSWAFYIVAMLIGLNAVTMFFFMPETKFTGTRPSILLPEDTNKDKEDIPVIVNVEDRDKSSTVATSSTIPKRSFVNELALWKKPDPNVNLLRVFLRPFVLVSYPTVLWACLIYGISLGWNVIIGSTVAQLFAEPYGFDSQALGLVFLSPFIGSLVGSWLCGSLSDSIANYFTHRNNGVREPEMRLPTLAIGTFLTFFGTLVASLTYHYHTHWAGPVIGFGILTAGAQIGVSLSMSYALDCHKEVSPIAHIVDVILTSHSYPSN